MTLVCHYCFIEAFIKLPSRFFLLLITALVLMAGKRFVVVINISNYRVSLSQGSNVLTFVMF